MRVKTPYADSYVKSHASTGYGQRYKTTFQSGYYGIEWDKIERPLLDRIFSEIEEVNNKSAFDFACGTGRITGVLAEHFGSVTGVDVSASMLEMAPPHPNVRLLQKNIIEERLGDEFDVATAFRFFLNAEPELREAAMEALAALLKPGGLLISNIHMNSRSPVGMIYRLRNRLTGELMNRTVSHHEFVSLGARHGLVAEETYWYGHTPRPGPVRFPGLQPLMMTAETVGNALKPLSPLVAQSFIVKFRKKD